MKERGAVVGNGCQLFVPSGSAHGPLTIEPDGEAACQCSAFHMRARDGGIAWYDPAIGIDPPLPPGVAPALSAQDVIGPRFADLDSPFSYDGRPLAPLS